MSVFKGAVDGKVHYIDCPKIIDSIALKTFELLSKRWKDLDVFVHVLEMSSVEEMDSGAYRQFTAFRNEIKKKNGELFVAWASAEIKKQIRDAGIENVFTFVEDLDEVTKFLNKRL